jgi:prevent-host-death family protein
MIVNSTEVQNNFGKYLMLVAREDIIITKNGREVAKLTTVDYIPGRANYMDAAVCEETAKYLFNNRKATYKEFLEFTKESQYRYEFIDGEIYLLSSPRFAHQWAMKEIFVAFCNWFEGKKCVPMAAPYDLTLWRDESTVSDSESDIEPNENDDKEPNIVQPDFEYTFISFISPLLIAFSFTFFFFSISSIMTASFPIFSMSSMDISHLFRLIPTFSTKIAFARLSLLQKATSLTMPSIFPPGTQITGNPIISLCLSIVPYLCIILYLSVLLYYSVILHLSIALYFSPSIVPSLFTMLNLLFLIFFK